MDYVFNWEYWIVGNWYVNESHISTKESVAYVKTAPQQGEGAFDYEMPMTQCAAYETRPTDPLYDFVN